MPSPHSSRKPSKESDDLVNFIDNRKMSLLEQRIDKRYIRKKKSDDRKTTEGVFDTKTLFYLYYLITHGFISYLHGVISTGKEANVYYGEREIIAGKDLDFSGIAVKIYRTSTADFKRMKEYIQGDPRFRKIRRGIRPLVYAWAQKEYQNLVRMVKVRIKVPDPIVAKGNILVTRFIGEDGIPAPRLKEYRITSRAEAKNLFKKLFKYVKLLYRDAELVHADLSEYNVLMLGEPYIIDVSQAVHIEHPLAEEYLERDVSNLVRYFTGLGVKTRTVEELIEEVHTF
ncbi:MAG: serine protein kinase RIO [Candidatus Ranarchaeia archaeon]